MGYVYILKSLKNGRYYIGSCIDIDVRFKQHNKGLVKSTKNLLPLSLEFFQKYDEVKTARQIEYKLKKLKSRKILEQIIAGKVIKLQI